MCLCHEPLSILLLGPVSVSLIPSESSCCHCHCCRCCRCCCCCWCCRLVVVTSPIYRTCSFNSTKYRVLCRCHSRQTPLLVSWVLHACFKFKFLSGSFSFITVSAPQPFHVIFRRGSQLIDLCVLRNGVNLNQHNTVTSGSLDARGHW